MSPTVTHFQIVTLSPDNVCYPGQTLKGQVIIHVSDTLKLKGLRVACHGCGRVAFHTGKIYQMKRDEYINQKITIFGKEEGQKGEVILPAGQHTLPFEIPIPTGIPASFEPNIDVLCYVRYWLIAVIDRSWKSDTKCKSYFTMGSVVDLNAMPEHSAPVTQNVSGTMFCGGCFEADYCAKHLCCCCESGPLTVTMTINKTAFVPGEPIVVDTEISNYSDRNVQWSRLKLIMVVTVKAGRGGVNLSLDLRKRVETLSHGLVGTGVEIKYTDLLHVPPLPPTGLPGCDLIDVKYFVRLTVKTTFGVLVKNLDTDVLIGTVPLRSAAQQAQLAFPRYPITEQPTPSAPFIEQPTASAPPFAAIDLPPPSYGESVFGAQKVKDEDPETSRSSSFAPSYNYYPWLSGGQTDELPSYDKLYK